MNHAVRLASGLAAALLLGVSAGATAAAPFPAGAASPRARANEQLAMLNHATEAFVKPSSRSAAVEMVSSTRPITGEQTVLPVIGHATDSHGGGWLEVLLPGRPNSHTGWIAKRATTGSLTGWQITIRLSTRAVTAFRDGRVAATFKAVVGKPSTPTPVGRFFVEETVKMSPQIPGAPYALALSARSTVLQEFEGGPGQIALHGTNGVGGTPGTAASHGCIRLATPAITWLAAHIGPGTPVTISN